ncbi:MAG: NFACT family protein [Nitrososphaerales archaeon]|jgi:predicted ribosome quality control (RQC) complex YloA/Tae2 family protein
MERVQKMGSLSGLEVRVLVKELGGLSGGYVSNIHSLGESQIFRIKKSGGEDVSLVVSPKYGAWITQAPAQTVTDEFTTSLRQELLRLKLDSVSQYDLDRVMFFRFSRDVAALQLILELMPPGNIILTDASGRIMIALREAKGTQRSIVRGRLYAPPPQSRGSPERADEASLAESFAREKTVGRALGRGLSLPRRYVDEILARAALNQDDPTPLPAEKVRQVSGVVRDLIASLDTPSPSLVRSGDVLELMAVTPTRAEVVESATSMSVLADRAFSPLLLEEESEPEREENQQAREYEVTLQRLEAQIAGLTEKAAGLRQAALATRAATSAEEIAEALKGSAVPAALRAEARPDMPPAAVASLLFDGAKGAEAEIRKIREVQATLAPRLRRAQRVTPKAKVRVVTRQSREWYEKFRWFFTTEGNLAVGGRDAQSNTILVKKHLIAGDVAYHADLFGSPFFILKGGELQTPDEIRQVAKATVAFSSAWKTGLVAADAYWVSPEQVSTSAPSGEFLAKGSFAIRGKKNFATKNPVEIAVGLDSKGRIMAGPEEALIRLSRAHLTLVPSREKSSDTAKKVLFELKKLYGDEMVASGVDDVMRVLPTGGGKIVRRRENRKGEAVVGEPSEGETRGAVPGA